MSGVVTPSAMSLAAGDRLHNAISLTPERRRRMAGHTVWFTLVTIGALGRHTMPPLSRCYTTSSGERPRQLRFFSPNTTSSLRGHADITSITCRLMRASYQRRVTVRRRLLSLLYYAYATRWWRIGTLSVTIGLFGPPSISLGSARLLSKITVTSRPMTHEQR